jgi:hypothetical protein
MRKSCLKRYVRYDYVRIKIVSNGAIVVVCLSYIRQCSFYIQLIYICKIYARFCFRIHGSS